MAIVSVEPGICGFVSLVRAEKIAKYRVTISIESDCDIVMDFAGRLENVGLKEIFHKPFNQNLVYDAAGQSDLHQGCPLPCAVIKAAEVELGLALKKNIEIVFED